MRYQVFVSYSSHNKDIAEKILGGLEYAGIRCWMAPRDIAPSRAYAEEIIKAIEECTVLVLILSLCSDTSYHVHRELDRAITRGLVIIPFLIEKFNLSKAMEYYISTCQYLDASGTPLEQHIAELKNIICSVLNKGMQLEVVDDCNTTAITKSPLLYRTFDYEIDSLLYGYFSRPYWEEQLLILLEQYSRVFVYGPAGVGKTTLAARMAERLKGGFFSFSIANRGGLQAINLLRAYYDFYQPFGHNLPLLPSHIEYEEVYDLLSLLVKTNFGISPPPFFIDGLDELSADELNRLVEILGRFANPRIPLIFFSRSKAHSKLLHKYFHHLSVLALETLSRDELRQWFAQARPSLEGVSDFFIDQMMEASEGNLLFLRGLPNSANKEDYLHFVEEIPYGLESVFEKLLNSLQRDNACSIMVLCLMALLPGTCSPEMLQVFLGINSRQAVQELIDTLSAVIKEVGRGKYILFHTRFAEYVRRELAEEIKAVGKILVQSIEDCYDLIYPLYNVPQIFVECGELNGLLQWIDRRIQELEKFNIEEIGGSFIRYEMLRAITSGFLLLHQTDKKVFLKAISLLERFIACNFQVMVDWRLGAMIEECLRTCLKVCRIEECPRVALLYAAVLYNYGQHAQSLELLNMLKELFSSNSRDYLRSINYIGLNYGALADYDKAIDAYSLLLASNNQDIENIWTGYALMNRGKLYMKKGNMEACLSDLLQATAVRKRVVEDGECFFNNRSDMGNMIQAELTLAMGYENLAKAYLVLANDSDSFARKEAARYIEKLALYMDSLLEQYQHETNSFAMTSRLLLTLVEYYIWVGNAEQAQHYYDYLSNCYIRSYDRSRMDKVKEELSRSQCQ